ncbi:hypothetical protein Taro_025569 [Colocasia esculenta]|uniref:Uncharacterized protein n=1 Tax=Colocasia esculenta TaxID=4460 RepID=A0A843V3N8_COLES|nr:hypothetical protein [Colocasia esculenta]
MGGPTAADEEGALQRVRSLSDMVLGFFEDERVVRDGAGETEDCSSDDEGDHGQCAEERRAFWESQHQLLQLAGQEIDAHLRLQAALSRSSSLETRVRRETEAALLHLRSGSGLCSCSRNAVGECRECLLRGVLVRLRSAGFNSALCRSRWRSSADIPKGEHTYIDVVGNAGGAKKGTANARVVVELSFRSEFEVARASEDYHALLRRLPEVFVGKAERLRGVLKVVCAAAKRCMKENRMHMPPWRKHKYMQAKWLSPCERMAAEAAFPQEAPAGDSPTRQQRPRASMLTFDLLEKMPTLHCNTAVEVV